MRNIRKDTSIVKRVELSCFTNMSPKCGIAAAEEYVKMASKWGMNAIAITDMANVQAFPEALRAVKKLKNPPKVIYGLHTSFDENHSHHDIDECKTFSIKDSNHTILVKNRTGLENLYRLLTDVYCNQDDFLKQLYKEGNSDYREGFLIGSGNLDSEIQELVENGIKKIEDFIDEALIYDYLEIHPRNHGLSITEFQKYVNYMLKLGEITGRPVVATGNAAYLNPEDELCLDVLCGMDRAEGSRQNGKKYFMTTDEMLNEFDFLGKEKSEEVVITNSRKIADQIENIDLIPDECCTLTIDNAYEMLEQACNDRINALYPAGVPAEAKKRLEHELEDIKINGYATDYVIGMKLVNRSNEDGFPVVLRGCGSASFAAFLARITDINPLQAHYYCPQCGKYEFIDAINTVSDDLEEKFCDSCGCGMHRFGYNLPSETFTGVNGNKDPDFDFNFSGEYQKKAIDNLKDIFGEDKIIRAGVIGNGYALAQAIVNNYNGYLSPDEKERIVDKLCRVKSANGVHPGGVLIVPKDVDILRYTPLQTIGFIKEKATHFEYHALEDKFKRLDCLGHYGPTMIHMLQKLTGKNLKLDSQNRELVLKLFENISTDDKDTERISYGTSGLPEFGNKGISELIKAIKPGNISDLIRMDALFHGTGVWEDNAKDLLEKGIAAFDEVICTRDDIYLYLLSKGIKRETAHDIMENVRKGKAGADKISSPEWNVQKAIMREHRVPEWYIDSCENIRYLFPKAHSTGYTLMSLKIALYKIFYPEEFYAVCVATNFDELREYIKLPDDEIDKICDDKENMSDDAEILREMKCRKVSFERVGIVLQDALTVFNDNEEE